MTHLQQPLGHLKSRIFVNFINKQQDYFLKKLFRWGIFELNGNVKAQNWLRGLRQCQEISILITIRCRVEFSRQERKILDRDWIDHSLCWAEIPRSLQWIHTKDTELNDYTYMYPLRNCRICVGYQEIIYEEHMHP